MSSIDAQRFSVVHCGACGQLIASGDPCNNPDCPGKVAVVLKASSMPKRYYRNGASQWMRMGGS